MGFKFINNDLDDWESIIESVEKSNIPIEFVNSVSIMYDTNKTRDININELRGHGWKNPEIEVIINENVSELNDVVGLNFYIDVKYVAATVSAQTEQLLRRLS